MAGPQRKSVNKKKVVPVKTVHIGAVDYKDTALLRKFISERGKIRARRVTGLSVQDQRKVAIARTPASSHCSRTPRRLAEKGERHEAHSHCSGGQARCPR